MDLTGLLASKSTHIQSTTTCFYDKTLCFILKDIILLMKALNSPLIMGN